MRSWRSRQSGGRSSWWRRGSGALLLCGGGASSVVGLCVGCGSSRCRRRGLRGTRSCHLAQPRDGPNHVSLVSFVSADDQAVCADQNEQELRQVPRARRLSRYGSITPSQSVDQSVKSVGVKMWYSVADGLSASESNAEGAERAREGTTTKLRMVITMKEAAANSRK